MWIRSAFWLGQPKAGMEAQFQALMDSSIVPGLKALHRARGAARGAGPGKVRLLGVSGSARNPVVPTFREQGLDFAEGSMDAWYGVLAPAKTPPSWWSA